MPPTEPIKRQDTKDGSGLALKWEWRTFGKDRLTTKTRQASFARLPLNIDGIETFLELDAVRWKSGDSYEYEGRICDSSGGDILSRDGFKTRIAAQEWAEDTLAVLCKAVLKQLYG